MEHDPLNDLMKKRDELILRHEELRAQEPFLAQTRRLQRLTEGLAFALQAIWFMSTRNRHIYDEFLSFRFFDDMIQSAVAIWVLAREGQITCAKREMRYMLESCAKHVYVDIKTMGTPLDAKIAYLENKVPRSSVSFTEDFQLYQFTETESKEFMNTVRGTYSFLCSYVHRSREQIEETLHLLEHGISPGFETAKEIEGFNRRLSALYDLVLVLHFNALGMSLTGDVFVHVLDERKDWPFHRTKFVKLLSQYFDYKHERKSR
jgi:hypothetical protein